MPVLPSSLAAILSLLRPAFTAPSFENFCALVHGFLGRVGEHTVTGVWQAARLAGVLHHSRAHGFFAHRRWSADELGLRLLGFVVGRFLDSAAPVRVAVDDTLFERSGRRVFAAGWHYDSAPKGAKLRFGNAFVCLGILVSLPGTGERTICLPLLFRLWRASAEGAPRPTKIELAHELVALVAERFAKRRIELLADGFYATKALAALPDNVAACVRLRSNAALYALPPKADGRPGRPRRKGARIGTPAQLAADPARPWKPVSFARAGGRDRVEALTLDCLWYSVLGACPVRVVIARDPGRRDRLEIALLSTDAGASAADILSRYVCRWAIEVAFQEAKGRFGVGEARNRVERAVRRTVPFGFLCQTITILWYSLNGCAERDVARRRKSAPWYRQKRSPSFADMLAALRRELIRAEFQRQVRAGHSSRKTDRLSLASSLLAA